MNRTKNNFLENVEVKYIKIFKTSVKIDMNKNHVQNLTWSYFGHVVAEFKENMIKTIKNLFH